MVVVGIVFRHLSLKPSILKEYAKLGADMIPAPPQRDLVSYVKKPNSDGDAGGQEDSIFLEDESGRILLDFSGLEGEAAEKSKYLVSGMIVAIRGRPEKLGVLLVRDICRAGLPTRSAPCQEVPICDEDRFVCILSGLNFGNADVNPLAIDLVTEFIKTNLGDSKFQKWGSTIVRLIVAGKLINASENPDIQNLRELDATLVSIASSIPIDLVPGDGDPTNFLLPQQPINKCLLPSSSRFKTLRRAPNPYEAMIGGRRFLGTGGQNVEDFLRYVNDRRDSEGAEKILSVLEEMIRSRHLAPTAPDTLASYPFYESVGDVKSFPFPF
uniref:DNA polymerase alpha subunit B n=1 Tax=Compsopogon caeruleus TaxID=31354 RepID=A0A7S1TJ81_9RHOD